MRLLLGLGLLGEPKPDSLETLIWAQLSGSVGLGSENQILRCLLVALRLGLGWVI